MDYDERTGRYESPTEWGVWWQSLGTVELELDLSRLEGVGPGERVRGKEVSVKLSNTSLWVGVRGLEALSGELWGVCCGAEAVWSVADGKLLSVQLAKASPTAVNVWDALFKDGSCPLLDSQVVQAKLAKEAFDADLDQGRRHLDHDDDCDD